MFKIIRDRRQKVVFAATQWLSSYRPSVSSCSLCSLHCLLMQLRSRFIYPHLHIFLLSRLLNKIHESDQIAAHKHFVLTSSHRELHVTKGRLLNFTGTQSPTLPELAYVIIYPSHTEHQTMFSHSVSLCGRLSLYVHFLFRDCFLISF